MATLVSLVCPSCGGKLEIASNVTSIACQYCGTEHMVKHEAGGAVMLEAYARCPVCGRNDKVEKVSAVIASQTHEISGTEQKTEEKVNAQGQKQVVVRDVPFTRKQVSVLGQRLASPPPFNPSTLPAFPPAPKPVKGGGISTIVAGVVCLGIALCGGAVAVAMLFPSEITYTQTEVTNIYLAFGLGAGVGVLFFLIGAALVIGGILMIVRARKQHPLALAQYQEQVESVNRERERITKQYEIALDRWNRLYYCARDDCVFIPAEGTSALVAGMQEFLFRAPKS